MLPQIFPEHLPGNRDGYGAFGVFWDAGRAGPGRLLGHDARRRSLASRRTARFCHQGSYRLEPDDPAQLVSAGPGTRVDPQAYIRFLIRAGADPRFNADPIMARDQGDLRHAALGARDSIASC